MNVAVFKKITSGLTRQGKFSITCFIALGLAIIPIAAYSLTMSDYLNQASVTSSANQYETQTTNNSAQVQIVPNAELIIVKQIINDNGGLLSLSDFNLATNAGSLSFDTGVVVENTTTFTSDTLYIPPGTYSLSGDDADGYTEGAWSCTVGTLSDTSFYSGEISLTFGQQAVCTIISDDIAPTLTLTKTLINDNGGSKSIDDFDISIDTKEVVSGVANNVLANTALNISELGLPGYNLGSWVCLDSTGLTTGLPTSGIATGQSVTLKPGSEVNCSITNDDIAPTLTLSKTIFNDDGGDLEVSDFDLSINGAEVINNNSNVVMANTDIVISELSMPGYAEGTWECVDTNLLTNNLPSAGVATGTTINLAEGAEVICSISNDDIAPQLTLIATVTNDNGGTLTIDDFDISINGVEVGSGVVTSQLANTSITISELDLVSYAEGVWSCVDANLLTAGLPTTGSATSTALELKQGSDVTCSIVNNDLGIDLSITKSVDDNTPNIGQTITFSLTVENAGPDIATYVTVSDVVPAGFTYISGSIQGGSDSDDSDPSGAGLSWTINSIPVGAPFVLNFDAIVEAP